jgi:hypothetical protein
METEVQQSCDFVGTPQLNFEEWAALLRLEREGAPKVIDPNAFAAWTCRRSVYGIDAAIFKVQCGLCGRGTRRQRLPVRADALRCSPR